jgi:hypothetical protein
MAAEVVAIAGPLVPSMPDWAPEQSAYVRVFEAVDAERIFAEEYPEARDLSAQLRNAGAIGTRVVVLFLMPGSSPARLFSYAGGIRDAIIECADHRYVLAAVFFTVLDLRTSWFNVATRCSDAVRYGT